MRALGVKTDVRGRQVRFKASKKAYSERALEISAHVFSSRAEVLLSEGKDWDVTLRAKRKDLGERQLAALAGDFLVELLNQEYRFLVSEMNKDIAGLQAAQALFAARGGEHPPEPPREDASFRREAERLLAEARKEAARTMPKRIAAPGTPPVPGEEAR